MSQTAIKQTNLYPLFVAPNFDGADQRIGIVLSRFNSQIGEQLLAACLGELQSLGVNPAECKWVSVPGALEIPIALQTLALSRQFCALIALGCVIRGDTYHFELVANESAAGVSQVALDRGIPVINAILTTDNLAQAEQRAMEKGMEAARAAVEMSNLLKSMA